MNSFYIAEASDKRISLSGVYKIYRRALGKLQKKCEEDEKLYKKKQGNILNKK